MIHPFPRNCCLCRSLLRAGFLYEYIPLQKQHTMKKAITIILIVIGILLIAAIVTPLIFKDEIIAKVKTEINKNVKAKVDFSDVDLSLLRHFPKLSVALEDLSVTGKGEFAT